MYSFACVSRTFAETGYRTYLSMSQAATHCIRASLFCTAFHEVLIAATVMSPGMQ